MKHFYFILLLITSTISAQVPANYYDTATGTGYTLKTQLNAIVTAGHTDQGYGALYTAYQTTHTDNIYENDGTVLDFYSENPTGTDPYNYTHGSRQCGTYNSENDCYNREHLFPQGFFDSNTPMRTDVHHVVPTDGYVNNRRSNYPFGEVSSPTWTSNNGSKVGPNTFGSYSGTV
ncbi:MAG: endonuclease, partial [Proteobacteria bacterium]|nr:endonuclease [Pseudomonadota bacterium]